MAYTITPILLGYADKQGRQKIYIRVICNRHIVKVPTHYKVPADQFENGAVINHPNKVSINANIRNEINAIETRLVDHLRSDKIRDVKELAIIANDTREEKVKIKFVDYIKNHNNETKGKKAENTVRIYNSLIPLIQDYQPDATFDQIDIAWLNLLEKHLRSIGHNGKQARNHDGSLRKQSPLDNNTIHKTMSKVKTLLNRAEEGGLIEKKAYDKYKVPVYVQKIVEYMSEEEMKAMKDLVDNVKNPSYKMAGYYFLLACYAGYRLSDLKKFDHSKSVKGDKIVLHTKKNKVIVSMPLHTRLVEILEYVKDNPLTIVEQKLRDKVKEIVKLAGIKRNIKIHTARHSFAMMLMDNDFELGEVAALLGNSLKSAAIYARISDKRLEKKVKAKLG